MKVKCINNEGFENRLTYFKIYEVFETSTDAYFIKDDIGDEIGFRKNRFDIVEE